MIATYYVVTYTLLLILTIRKLPCQDFGETAWRRGAQAGVNGCWAMWTVSESHFSCCRRWRWMAVIGCSSTSHHRLLLAFSACHQGLYPTHRWHQEMDALGQ